MKVKLIKKIKNSAIEVGMIGTVIEVLKNVEFPYKIQWANGTINSYTGISSANFKKLGDDVSRRKRKKNKKKNKKKKFNKQRRQPVTPVGGQGQIFGVTTPPLGKVAPVDDSWEVDLDIVEECGKACTNGAIIWVKPLAKVKIDALMEEYKSREWLAYLLGDKESNTVEDIYIPEQVATAARVDDVECGEFNDMPVIGVIHSHHSMGTGFSHTDHTYINQNHDISLVVSHTGIDGQIRHKVPCGALKISEIKVRMAFDIEFDKESFIKKAKENISFHRTGVNNWQQGTWNNQAPKNATGKSPYGFFFNGKWCSTVPKPAFCSEKGCSRSFQAPTYKVDDGTAGACPMCRNRKVPADQVATDDAEKTLAQSNQDKIEEQWNSELPRTTEKGEEHTCPRCYQVWIYAAEEVIHCPNCDDEPNKATGDEWSTGRKSEMGTYMCGRCNASWANVNLKVFKCPNCDGKPEEKSLEEELQMLDDSMSEGTENQPFCRICKKSTKYANSVHQGCLQKEKAEIGQAMTNGGSSCEVCGKPVVHEGASHYKCIKKQEFDETQPII